MDHCVFKFVKFSAILFTKKVPFMYHCVFKFVKIVWANVFTITGPMYANAFIEKIRRILLSSTGPQNPSPFGFLKRGEFKAKQSPPNHRQNLYIKVTGCLY